MFIKKFSVQCSLSVQSCPGLEVSLSVIKFHQQISQQITLRRVGLGLLQTLHLIAVAFWDNLVQLSFFYLYYFRELQIYEKPVCGDFGTAKGVCNNHVFVYEGNYIELK